VCKALKEPHARDMEAPSTLEEFNAIVSKANMIDGTDMESSLAVGNASGLYDVHLCSYSCSIGSASALVTFVCVFSVACGR
jgi:hypothetical protein